MVAVSFDTLRAPNGTLRRSSGRETSWSQRKVRQAVFAFRSSGSPEHKALRLGGPVLHYPVRKAVNAAENDEDDDYDDDDDDDDEGVTFLQWQMPSTPLQAEPVSDEDEQHQFDTITAGNVPALFLGKAYTNAAVNIIGMHKMQKLLEDMYYHLVAPRPDQEAINTIGLLLRAPHTCLILHQHSHTFPLHLHALIARDYASMSHSTALCHVKQPAVAGSLSPPQRCGRGQCQPISTSLQYETMHHTRSSGCSCTF